MPNQNKNIELIQKSLTGQGKAKEPHENNVDNQDFQLTSGKWAKFKVFPQKAGFIALLVNSFQILHLLKLQLLKGLMIGKPILTKMMKTQRSPGMPG